MRNVLLALCAVWLLTGGAGEVPGGPGGTAPADNPLAGDPKAIQDGEVLYKRVSCHGCHGGNARGGNGPDLTDDEWQRAPSDQMIFNTIKFGRKGTMMSPFKDDLTDDQIWALVSYLRYLGEQRKAEGK